MAEFREEVETMFGKSVFKFLRIAGILSAIYIIASLVFGFFPFSVASGVVKKVVNSDAIIGNYQWFYDQHNAIQSQRANYESLPSDAYERTGLRMVLNNMIAEYNSRSKQITRNLWKAGDLPYQITLIGGVK